MPSVEETLAIENSREAGLIGGISALLAGIFVNSPVGPDVGDPSLAVGALTAVLFFVLLVGLSLSRL